MGGMFGLVLKQDCSERAKEKLLKAGCEVLNILETSSHPLCFLAAIMVLTSSGFIFL
ncbi:unnamed protein product [marine sediment metagenome]|uniref:Uncharacterized protein n=1 Tax=marine sediment metagenome TaxID=412755 RepID=X1M364_9ZZZZ